MFTVQFTSICKRATEKSKCSTHVTRNDYRTCWRYEQLQSEAGQYRRNYSLAHSTITANNVFETLSVDRWAIFMPWWLALRTPRTMLLTSNNGNNGYPGYNNWTVAASRARGAQCWSKITSLSLLIVYVILCKITGCAAARRSTMQGWLTISMWLEDTNYWTPYIPNSSFITNKIGTNDYIPVCAEFRSHGILYKYVKYNEFVTFVPPLFVLPRDATQSAVVPWQVVRPSLRL